MKGLLDVATVLRGDGNWTAGYEVDALACGRSLYAADVCAPAETPEPEDSATGFSVHPFAIIGGQKFGTRCAPDDAGSDLEDALESGSETLVAEQFWTGSLSTAAGSSTAENMMFLDHADVVTVDGGSTTADTLAAVLEQAHKNHPELEPVIHLGMRAAMDVQESVFTDAFDAEYVVSPGYPINGVAVTGPVVVHLGTIELLTSHDTSVNRFYTAATRVVAIEFDPCLAVKATTV